MNSPPQIHPDDATLRNYGLGKLDDAAASVVDRHLEHCVDCHRRAAGVSSDSFLGRLRDARVPSCQSSPADGSMSFLQARPPAPPSPPPAETLPPGLLDHADYRIKRELGRGGMGVVYLAHNTMMGRDEVLKVMGGRIVERPGVLDRFLREIRSVARLRHPNIVAAHHAFRLDGGLVFAMEYIEGLDLSKLVKSKGPLAVSHAAYFAHQAALGLQHAHEHGLVHRDIKPHNLMLTHDGRSRLVKILDFGLAKASREDRIDSHLTLEGQALGTPDYIAPEQILNAPDVDIRADIYSLGATLYYLLTGRPPFQANSLYDLYQAHVSRDADPLNLIRPEVPAELAALVAKAMAKSPGRRFQTPSEMAGALTPFFRKADRAKPGGVEADRAGRRPIELREPPPAEAPEPGPAGPGADAGTTGSEASGGWAGLIEISPPESLRDAGRAARPNRARPPRKKWLAAVAGLAIVLPILGIIVSIKDERGNHLTSLLAPDGGRVEIAPAPGPGAGGATAQGRKIALFNGKDTAGWVDPHDAMGEWKVVDGVLGGLATADRPIRLMTIKEDYGDFRLVARILNNGQPKQLYVRYSSDGSTYRGYGIQVSGAATRADIRAPLGSINKADGRAVGGLIDWDVEAEPVEVPIDEWYTQEITAVGDRITSSINGKVVATLVDHDQPIPAGQIALFCRGNRPVRYREITIEELPKGAGTSAATAPQPPNSPEAKPKPDLRAIPAEVMDGSWVVEGDELVETEQRRGGGQVCQQGTAIAFGDPSWSHYDLTFQGKLTGGVHGIKARFHYVDRKNYCEFALASYANRFSDVSYSLDGTWGRDNANSRPQAIETDRWYAIKIEVRGPEFRCFVDGEEIFHNRDERYTKGRIGFSTWDSTARFRDIKVTDPQGAILWEGPPRL